MRRAWLLVVVALLWAGQALTQSVSSTRLTDTIDKGVGDIDLMRDVTAAQLEIYRSANGGRLVFGVDINEAANGTEKATSQGVTVADAWLEVGFADGTTRVYGHAGGFWTETQVLVAASGSTARAERYTLLGESGSNRITASNAVQGIFDSTLKVAVPDRLDAAVSAVLKVRLLDTNVKLGDPEAFYDYTAGFEDLAILVPADATYLDAVLPQETTFRSEAPAMELSPQGEQTQSPSSPSLSWIQQPGADSYYMAAYEDMAPDRGDYDFNDLVVAYRYQLGVNANGLVERIDGVAYLVARGSVYRHDWILDLPLVPSAAGNATCGTATGSGQALLPCGVAVAGGQLRWTPFQDTVAAFPAPGATAGVPVNTPTGNGFTRGPKATFSVTFAAPIAVAAMGAGSPWLDVRSTAKSVVLADRDAQGYPFAMLVPSAWRVPVERQDMGLAYPQLAAFVASGGTQGTDWYRDPVASLVQPWAAANWAW